MGYSLKIKLKTTPDKAGKHPIYIQYIYKRRRLLLPTNMLIESTYWLASEQIISRRLDSNGSMNTELLTTKQAVDSVIQQYYNEHGHYPSPDHLRQIIKDNKPYVDQTSTLSSLWAEFLTSKKNSQIRPATLDIYNQTWNKWNEYTSGHNYTYKDINFDLLFRFGQFLIQKGYQKNTRGKAIKTIKTFFNYLLLNKGLAINHNFKLVEVEKEEKEISVLTPAEIDILAREVLYFNQLPKFNINENQKLIGRIMLFLCDTGLSFVDFSSLTTKNLIIKANKVGPAKLYLELTRQKVDTAKCIIPIMGRTIDIIMMALGMADNSSAEELLHRSIEEKMQLLTIYLDANRKSNPCFDNIAIFPNIQPNKFNKEIKELLKTIQIDELELTTAIQGKQKKEVLVPKYARISAHTGRRTYITQSFKNGIAPIIIMKTTGHAKIETMNRYNKIESDQIYNAYAQARLVTPQ